MAENELELVLKLGDQLSPKLREIMNTLKAASQSRQVKDTETGFEKIGKAAQGGQGAHGVSGADKQTSPYLPRRSRRH